MLLLIWNQSFWALSHTSLVPKNLANVDADEHLVLETDAVFIGVFTCIPFTEELGWVFFKM